MQDAKLMSNWVSRYYDQSGARFVIVEDFKVNPVTGLCRGTVVGEADTLAEAREALSKALK